MGYPRAFIDEVRRSVDPVAVIGEVVALKKRGARFVGLCPFHQEKTPSFTVNDEGLWYCFGCGAGGDIFRFIMEHDAVDFGEAVRTLAERTGLQPPAASVSRPQARRGPRIDRPRAREALAVAEAFYCRQLGERAGRPARRLLDERGFGEELIATFGLGFAPDGWEVLRRHLHERGFSDTEGEAAGLLKSREAGDGAYDRLRKRVVFPIRDVRGRTIAFGGRVIDTGEPKYLNSPETVLFEKSRTLYGLAENRAGIESSAFALLVEGYFDLLACAQYGFRNAVAPLGTSFTQEHARLLGRFTRKVVVNFDGDDAGMAAAERTVGLFLGQGFQVNVVQLPGGHDPDSFLREQGADAYAGALRRSESALEFLVGRVGLRADLGTPRGKAEALSSLLGFVEPIADVVERAEWIGRLAERLGIDRHLVEEAAADLFGRGRRRQVRATATESGARWRTRLEDAPLAERELLRAVLEHPEWRGDLEKVCSFDELRDGRVRSLLRAAAACEVDGIAIEPAGLLARCEEPGAEAMLSRLRVEGGAPMDWDAARNCALGIRDAALRRRLKQKTREIEQAVETGDTERLGRLHREKESLLEQLQAS